MSTSSNDYLSPQPNCQHWHKSTFCLCRFAHSVALRCLLKHRADQWSLLVGPLRQPHWPSPATYFLTCSLGMSYSISSPPCFLLLSLRLILNVLLSRKTCFFLLFSFRPLILYPQSTFLDAHHLAVVSYDCNYLLEINSIDVYVCVCLSVYMCTVCVQLPKAARRGHWMLWSCVEGGCESPGVMLLESLSRWREVCMLSGVFLFRGCRARHGGECLYWQHWEGQAVQR